MEEINNILKEIAETLKEISKTNKARLELEKEVVRENKKGMKKAMKIWDVMRGKGEQVQKDLLDMLGVKEKIDLDNIELGDDLK